MATTYFDQVKADVKKWLFDNASYMNIDFTEDRDDLIEHVNDILWCEDSVTGNGSGSYTFNSYKAKEHVFNDTDTVIAALQEFCVDATEIAKHFISEDWEWLDVTARCYVLYSAVSEAIDEIKTELEKDTEQETPAA